jgi:hypothetical protein
MVIILMANKVNLFVSSVLFVFWYHLPNFLETPHIIYISTNEHLKKSAKLLWPSIPAMPRKKSEDISTLQMPA